MLFITCDNLNGAKLIETNKYYLETYIILNRIVHLHIFYGRYNKYLLIKVLKIKKKVGICKNKTLENVQTI